MYSAASVAMARIVSDWLPPKVEANSGVFALIPTRWDRHCAATDSSSGAVRLRMRRRIPDMSPLSALSGRRLAFAPNRRNQRPMPAIAVLVASQHVGSLLQIGRAHV